MDDLTRPDARAAYSQSPRPLPGSARPYRFPEFERRRLSNDVELILAPVKRLPLVSIRFLIDCGASTEPVDQAGLASLTAQGLAEGTERHDGATLAARFERLGGALGIGTSWDGAALATTVLSDRVAEAVEIMADVMRRPTFPDREVERLRAERMAELLEIRTEPRGLADECFNQFVFAQGSRFALPDAGSRDTVLGLRREDLLAFHSQRFGPSALSVVVSGDFDAAAVARVLEDHLGDWSGRTTAASVVPNVPAHSRRAVRLVKRVAAAQTELRIGHVGLPRAHPDYFPVVVMNAILGGVFNSRLNLNLRERHGYTYGASSGFQWRRDAGPFVISTAVATDVSDAAVTEILLELDQMCQTSPSDSEVTLVQSYLEGVFPIRFETTEAIAAALTSLQTFALPDDFYSTYRDQIREVTAADVLRVAREHLHPDRVQIVAVGDVEQIGPRIGRLELGPVSFADAEGKVASAAGH